VSPNVLLIGVVAVCTGDLPVLE
jgi:hypothetical protein